MDASVSDKGHEWSDYDTAVMLDEVYRCRPVLLEMPKQTARHQVTMQVSAQRACEITMQGNAAKLRLAAYAQNVCDMRTLSLARRQHNRHRRAQKQHAKYTVPVWQLTTANRTRRTYIVHRTMHNSRQLTTKPAAVAVPASCVADLVTQALCGYCQQLKSARNYRALMHIILLLFDEQTAHSQEKSNPTTVPCANDNERIRPS